MSLSLRLCCVRARRNFVCFILYKIFILCFGPNVYAYVCVFFSASLFFRVCIHSYIGTGFILKRVLL
jgi:hypothetical protein